MDDTVLKLDYSSVCAQTAMIPATQNFFANNHSSLPPIMFSVKVTAYHFPRLFPFLRAVLSKSQPNFSKSWLIRTRIGTIYRARLCQSLNTVFTEI